MLAVILAAGQGTRMRSSVPKVLHTVGGLPMVSHVVRAAQAAGAERIALVVGPEGEDVVGQMEDPGTAFDLHIQHERLGTAHAVLAARASLEDAHRPVVVLFADTPLVTAETITAIADGVRSGAAIVAAGFHPQDPSGYGRLLTEGERLVAIREHKDASPEERRVRLCNAGLMGFDGALLPEILDEIGNENAQGEYYLPDAVEIASARGLDVRAVTVDAADVMGVNDRVQLAGAEAMFQERRRRDVMLDGATLVDPTSVTLSHDTMLGQDVVVEPHVVFGPGVDVESGATIRAFSHLEGATVASGAIVGPYARLRPGAKVGPNARVGNFCEVKNAELEEGAKVNHLSYIGDARVGARANVGAGTITCNYDGFDKHFTDIGANSFIGSDTALVAPVSVGDGAMTGSGSVITEDVPPDALALARGRQVNKDGRARAFREAKSKP